MEKEFLSYKESLELKELGFDESCFGYYDGNHNLQYMFNGKPENFTKKRMGVSNSVLVGWISAPLLVQAFYFFRNKYNLHHTILFNHIENNYDFIYGRRIGGKMLGTCKDYEEAQLECLKKLIELAKEQNVK